MNYVMQGCSVILLTLSATAGLLAYLFCLCKIIALIFSSLMFAGLLMLAARTIMPSINAELAQKINCQINALMTIPHHFYLLTLNLLTEIFNAPTKASAIYKNNGFTGTLSAIPHFFYFDFDQRHSFQTSIENSFRQLQATYNVAMHSS